MTSNDEAPYLLDRIREAMRSNGAETPLGQAVARLEQPFVLGDGEKWHYEGFVSLFSAVRQAVAAIDDTIPPDLPPFLLDPGTIARMFRIPLEDFNWQGNQGLDGLAGRLDRIEEKLESKKGAVPEAEFVSVKQAAAITQLSESHLRRALWSRELPAANAGTPAHPLWRISRKDLMGWLKARVGGNGVPPRSQLAGLVGHYFPDS